MQAEDREAVRHMLEAHNTLTLATSHAGRPWAASLFFASDKRLNLYFVSDYRTRHARHIEECATAVTTVNADCAAWGDVRGLQIEGRVTVVSATRRGSAAMQRGRRLRERALVGLLADLGQGDLATLDAAARIVLGLLERSDG